MSEARDDRREQATQGLLGRLEMLNLFSRDVSIENTWKDCFFKKTLLLQFGEYISASPRQEAKVLHPQETL